MFRNPTVFVLGAGASWHYGYPTGQELIQLVIDSANCLLEDVNKRLIDGSAEFIEYEKERHTEKDAAAAQKATRQECLDIIERLKANNPITIDHFLRINPKLRTLGKLLIAHALILCKINKKEQQSYSCEGRHDCQHDWIRFIIAEMTRFIDKPEDLISGNKVKFITFNYEMSLERRIIDGLYATELFGDRGLIDRFMSDRFIHMYGALQEEPTECSFEWDVAYNASRELCVVGEVDKDKYVDRHLIASNWISAADRLFFLGFGFDRENSELLNIRSITKDRSDWMYVYFTNFCNVANVDSDICRLFNLSFHGPIPSHSYDPNRLVSYYKSEKDVYRALQEDLSMAS